MLVTAALKRVLENKDLNAALKRLRHPKAVVPHPDCSNGKGPALPEKAREGRGTPL
jgi:hypothetical protein